MTRREGDVAGGKSRVYLVDAFNLMHDIDMFKKDLDLDCVGEACSGLVNVVSNWVRVRPPGPSAILVFDGHWEGCPDKAPVGGVELRYVPGKADPILAALMHNSGDERVLVSADRELIDKASELGRESMHPRDFFRMLSGDLGRLAKGELWTKWEQGKPKTSGSSGRLRKKSEKMPIAQAPSCTNGGRSAKKVAEEAVKDGKKARWRSDGQYRWGTYPAEGDPTVEIFTSKVTGFTYVFERARLKLFHSTAGNSSKLKSVLPKGVIAKDREWLIPLLNEYVPGGKALLDAQRSDPGNDGAARQSGSGVVEVVKLEEFIVREVPIVEVKVEEKRRRVILEEITRRYELNEHKLRRVLDLADLDLDGAVVEIGEDSISVNFEFSLKDDVRPLMLSAGLEVPESASVIGDGNGGVEVSWTETKETVEE